MRVKRALKTTASREMRSLFCGDGAGLGTPLDFPYYLSLRGIADRSGDRFPGVEACAFAQVVEHEVQYYEPRGWCAGPLSIRLKDRSLPASNRARQGNRFRIPAWLEADNLEFGKQTITGVVVVESWAVFDRLCRSRAWSTLNMAIVCGPGIPRTGLRRFIHRLAEEAAIPVYLLTDNDTWGYFIFSLLKRGLLAPQETCPWLAINDLRFLGIRADDVHNDVKRELQLREWQSGWDVRMQCLERYECFRGTEWQQEFKAFRRRKGAINLLDFYTAIGSKQFVRGYLCTRISNEEWLR